MRRVEGGGRQLLRGVAQQYFQPISSRGTRHSVWGRALKINKDYDELSALIYVKLSHSNASKWTPGIRIGPI